MEIYRRFMARNTLYYQYVNATQSNAQTECHFYQNPNDFFCRSRKIHPKTYVVSQWTPSSDII